MQKVTSSQNKSTSPGRRKNQLREALKLGFGIFGVMLALAPVTRGRYLAIWTGCTICMATLVLAIFDLVRNIEVIRHQRGFNSLANEYGGKACKQCLYILRGLSPIGTCPECGAPYDLSTTGNPQDEKDREK